MALELNINKLGSNATVADSALATDNFGVNKEKATGPILRGESLTVTSAAMSDLEKLVARLKNESAETRQSVAQRRISIMQTVLDSLNSQITEADKNALVEIEELSAEQAELEQNVASLTSDKASVQNRIDILDTQIKALEDQIEQAVQDGKDHREQVEKLKQLRKAEEAKLQNIENSIASATARISEIDVKIAECSDSIGKTKLAAVSNAFREAIGEPPPSVERDESNADRVAEAEKSLATDIARGIRKAIDVIDEQITKALDESLMKVEG